MQNTYDAVVIGGGFFGCNIALFLSRIYKKILLIEAEKDLLLKSSYVNQARIHNGYHYPRNFLTAYRSHVNFELFSIDFQEAVDSSFTKVYALAKNNSKTSAKQFEAFIKRIGAPFKEAPQHIKRIFNLDLIENIYEVKEYVFNAAIIREKFKDELKKRSIDVLLDSEVVKIRSKSGVNLIQVKRNGSTITYCTQQVLNVTYAGINHLLLRSQLPPISTKQEITEVVLIEQPQELKSLGVTVMDGPFFSTLPFPDKKLHSLTHVRFTPRQSWMDDGSRNPYNVIKSKPLESNFTYMIKDAARYLPLIAKAQYKESLYEIKTLLLTNEEDDGRPIFFKTDYHLPGFHIVMGGKIDNIYDIMAALKKYYKVAF